MKILFAAWEVDPFFKWGGLGDIARSLPIALHQLKVDIRLIVPLYKTVKFLGQKKERIHTFHIEYGSKSIPVTIYKVLFPESTIPIYFLQNHNYFDAPEKETFALFDFAIIEILKKNLLDWQPDVIHCNDHHTGLIPLLVKANNLPIKTLLTIHNLSYQGPTSIKLIRSLPVPAEKFHPILWETKDRQINFLKEGILNADKINAVSPTYAKEILTEEYGENLNETLNRVSDKLTGILNGIDYTIRNSTNDPFLKFHYDLNATDSFLSTAEGKAQNKAYLQKKLGFEVNPDIPLIGFIGRFAAKQKGIELMHRMIRRMNLEKYQFIILGRGSDDWEERFTWLAEFNPKHVSYSNDFSESMASHIYGGCDFIMIPSKFEPCGLIQMIAMKYGCLPIARATGGLKDSIDDNINGFLFEKYSSQNLENTVKYACKLLQNHPDHILAMRKNAMKKDFSWHKSAQEYMNVYKELLRD